ncbi:MAG: NUDIX domain-containing protein [Pseudomonadota bacterium]|nr:NUDIX domain-containing protein [Pseudomonadota bacterium]
MAGRRSAGLLLYRRQNGTAEVLLVHPGGPFFLNKDAGAWSIPKGEYGDDEEGLDAARREFREETGMSVEGPFHALAPVRQAGGKVVLAWAVPGDLDADAVRSNSFSLEWPPRSGQWQTFPEVDRAAWFNMGEAAVRILAGQRPLIDELARLIAGDEPGSTQK